MPAVAHHHLVTAGIFVAHQLGAATTATLCVMYVALDPRSHLDGAVEMSGTTILK